MINQKSLRLQHVKQILRTMDSQFDMNGESEIWVDGHQWYILLPDDEPNQVLLRFNAMNNCTAADLALRFGGIAWLLGLEVYPGADICLDSTNSNVGLISYIEEN